MRNKFDEQLSRLHEELKEMGAQCENSIACAAKALLDGDVSLAEKAIAIEKNINQSERDIESLCLSLLLQQQPVARDLRQISAALKMITDMERIGDQAADISEILLLNTLGANTVGTLKIGDMARAAIQMVTECVEAFVNGDLNMAKKVLTQDDAIDDLFNGIRKGLVTLIAKNPALGEAALDVLMIAKYFERIGDHAENIAEWVVFSITGLHKGEIPRV